MKVIEDVHYKRKPFNIKSTEFRSSQISIIHVYIVVNYSFPTVKSCVSWPQPWPDHTILSLYIRRLLINCLISKPCMSNKKKVKKGILVHYFWYIISFFEEKSNVTHPLRLPLTDISVIIIMMIVRSPDVGIFRHVFSLLS